MPLPGFIPDVDGYMYTRLHTSQLPSTACQRQYQSSDRLRNDVVCVALNSTPTPNLMASAKADFFSVLGDIAESDFAYCDRRHYSVVCLSVCLSLCLSLCPSRSYIVLKRQKSIRFLLHTTARCVCHWQITLKFGLHQSTPSSPYFAPK